MTPQQAKVYHALNDLTEIGVEFGIANMARIMERAVCITITKWDLQEALRTARDQGYATSAVNKDYGGEPKTLWTRIADLPPPKPPCTKTRVKELIAADVSGGGVSNRINRIRLPIEPWWSTT